MRKIGSERELEKRKKRNMTIISLFILAVLVVSTAGYAFISRPDDGSNTGTSNAEGTVRYTGSLWAVTINGVELLFTNSPEEVENVSVEGDYSLVKYSGASVYLVSGNTAVKNEIATTLGRYTAKMQEACYGECTEDLPEKDCSSNLIVWADSSQNRVYQQENCVFIEGDLRAVDAFLYKTFEV